ncbi:MAG: Tricarboxylate transport sensor protein TctE [Myxococcales bacterium]|nr:Tricarboxylate transport sensor protein TctE [Myxococcales bacterium]
MPSGLVWRLVVSFLLAVVCFGGSTVYTESISRDIDAAALSIAGNAVPSIELLTEARSELRHLDAALTRYAAAHKATDRQEILATRARIDGGFEHYLTLPVYPGEDVLKASMHHALRLVDHLVDGVLAGQAVPPSDISATLHGGADELRRAVDLNAEQARRLALRIQRDHDRSSWAAVVLDLLSTLFTALAAWLALRALAHHHRVVEERNELMSRRAEELEQFASRVAHDILGPLSATRLAVEFAAAHTEDPAMRRTLERGKSGILRVASIVDGLLRFARAGARPDPGVVTPVVPVAQSVIAELQPVAEAAGVTLTLQPPATPCSVSAHPGVLASVVENLTRNAIKYMGERPTKTVAIRVVARPDRVRFEVQDSGPGIPPALIRTVFDPHVRGRTQGQPGIGLGLATVKRVVEAHGGSVGVDSKLDDGTTFWCELARADYVEVEPDSRAKRASAQAGK